MGQLSMRGTAAVEQVLRKDFDLFFDASQDLFHSANNPDGKITLNIAENVLSWPLLQDKISEITSSKKIPDWVAGYTSCLGHPDLRETLALFFTRYFCDAEVYASDLAVSAGATAVVEMTSLLLCDPGDVAVFPAPCYPVYTMDIGNKAGVERYDLVTHDNLSLLYDGPLLNIRHLEETRVKLLSQGKKFRMLVITSPDNPTGGIYAYEKLEEIADWCIRHSIHMVVNEIYGLSLVPSYDGEGAAFRSFAGIMAERKSDFLHRWYSLSKDFGASGFRVGVLHSMNKDLIRGYDNLNAPHLVSNHTQWIFQEIFADQRFLSSYIVENQRRLDASCELVQRALDEMNIPYVPVQGSLFVWMDMSEFLFADTKEADDELWMDIYRQTGVLLTPGDGFGHTNRGMFRLVYSCVSSDALSEAMTRLKGYVMRYRKQGQ